VPGVCGARVERERVHGAVAVQVGLARVPGGSALRGGRGDGVERQHVRMTRTRQVRLGCAGARVSGRGALRGRLRALVPGRRERQDAVTAPWARRLVSGLWCGAGRLRDRRRRTLRGVHVQHEAACGDGRDRVQPAADDDECPCVQPYPPSRT
jgi:hypothetical protein